MADNLDLVQSAVTDGAQIAATATAMSVVGVNSVLDSLSSAINSFNANVPLTTTTSSEAFSAVAGAGFNTSSFSSYDSQVEEIKNALNAINTKLQGHVSSTVRADEKIEENIPEELEEIGDGTDIDDDDDILTAEESAQAAVSDLDDSKMNAGKDADSLSKEDVVQTEIKDDKKEDKEKVTDITKGDTETKDQNNNTKTQDVVLTDINTSNHENDTSDDNVGSDIHKQDISNINNKQEIIDKCKKNFSKISKEDLKSLLKEMYKKAMEKHLTLEEFLTDEKNSSIIKDMLASKSSLDKDMFNNLFNQDKKEFSKVIHDGLLGSNNCLGFNAENKKELKSYLTYEVSKKNQNLSDLLNNKGNTSELRSVLNEYKSKNSNKFNFFVETISGFDDKTMCYALKTMLK